MAYKRKSKKKKHKKKRYFLKRFIRSIVSVVVLSALVLGIILLVKELSTATPSTFAKYAKLALSKININVSEEELSEVTGDVVERIGETNLASSVSSEDSEDISTPVISADQKQEKLRAVILADIHGDIENLQEALQKADKLTTSVVFVLGDISNVGDIRTMDEVKDVLQESKIDFYAIPGDHDLAQTLDADNFIDVFGPNYHKVQIAGINFLLIDNSPNFTPMDPKLISWLENNIEGADFILLSQPLYTQGIGLFFDDIFMGSTKETPEDENILAGQEAVLNQGKSLLELFRETKSIKAIIAGDHHRSSEVTDPDRSSLNHYIVGAVAGEVSEYSQSVIQSPRFSLLTIYEDDSYSIEDIILD